MADHAATSKSQDDWEGLTHCVGGTSTKVLLYLMKQPVLRTERTKSEEEYSTYSPAPSSFAKLLENVTTESSSNRICRIGTM